MAGIVKCMICPESFATVAESMSHEHMRSDWFDNDPERILTQEVLTHDVDGLERLLAQFKRGLMTAHEYVEQVGLVVIQRERKVNSEEL